MAFITGLANSLAELKTALINECVANGWSNNGDIIYKTGCAVEIVSQTAHFDIYGGTGQTGGVVSNKSTQKARIGGDFVTYPVQYDLHVFDNEVYLIIEYNTDFYQQMSFGISTVAGSGGGPWFTASANGAGSAVYANGMNVSSDTTLSAYCFSTVSTIAGGLFIKGFWEGEVSSSFAYTNINGVPGWYGPSSGPAASSSRLSLEGAATKVRALLYNSPNDFNGATILTPIKETQSVDSTGHATVVNLENARFCRIDNIAPGEIISFGAEQWKVYPWLRKNASVRNGVNNGTSAPPNHSGTLGYVIRYTGA